MPDSWLSFVPYHLAQEILSRPGGNPIGREQRFPVIALFADVSGFTPISEALSKVGKVGAEELTDVLNSYFAPMIELIQSYGGIIGKFGGDAMTVLFPFTARTQQAAARRALQCALDMQAAMPRYAAITTSAGVFGLAMRAGLAIGDLLCLSVGDPIGRLEYLIAGSVLDRCADAEHYASIGEVIAHRDVCTAAGLVQVSAERGDYRCITRLQRRARIAPLAPLDRGSPAAHSMVARYIHPVVAQRFQAGQTGFINEHRRVTVLFVGFEGFDYDADPSVGGLLQSYLVRVILIIQRYDGYLNKVDMGDKGSKYIVLFGAPVAHENDEERAIRCALDLLTLGIAVRIGVNTGFVYCGLVGSLRRQEYTAMGDPVNLAARLMQAATPGQILVSATTQRRAGQGFDWETLAPLQVKGKAAPIEVAAVRAAAIDARLQLSEPHYGLPMVGRVAELGKARQQLEQALHGQGQVIGILAEAGMGKSRMGAEIITAARGLGFTCYGGACQSYGAGTAYLVWQGIWRNLFGLDAEWPAELQIERLSERLAELDLSLTRRLPLLGVLLNLPIPENDLTAAFDAQQRVELLKSLLLICLRRLAQLGPLLIMLEDCHWIDLLSRDLCEFLGRNLVDLPICLVSLYRPADQEADLLAWGERSAHVTTIHLVELEPEQATQLIALKLEQLFGQGTSVTSLFAQQLAERAEGNPFYLEEMLNYLRDRGFNPANLAGLQSLDLPDSLHSLIISRIDQLAESEKTTLKLASVIGRLFRANWLWGSYPEIGDPDQVLQHLQNLSRLDLTPLDTPAPELEYLFKHITTLEVAYESLAVATRSVLHEHIGAFIERLSPGNHTQYLTLLAFHYGRSRNQSKQRIFFRLAATAARSAYANDAAIDFYQRLLPLLSGQEQAVILCELGQVCQLIGRWAEAEVHYRTALELAEQAADLLLQARCQLALGYLMWCKATYPEALIWLEQAHSRFEQGGDRQGVSQTLGRIGLVYSLQGDFPRALAYFEQQAQIAAEIGDAEGQAQALGHIGSVFQERGQLQLALDYYERQQQIASQSGNRRELLFVIGNIGVIEQYRGNFPQALHNLSEALRLAVEIGDQQTVSIAAINMGEVYRAQGAYTHALICYQFGLAAAIELDDRTAIVATVANIAQAYVGLGLRPQARRLLEIAVQLVRGLNIPLFLAYMLTDQTRLNADDGLYAAAKANNTEVQAIVSQIEVAELLLKTELLAIEVQVALGQISRQAAAAAGRLLWEQWTEESERAPIALLLWQFTNNEEYRSYAAQFYSTMYAQSPRAEYRRDYEHLTGEHLPDPVPLPAPPALIGDVRDLDALLIRVEALIPVVGPGNSAQP